MLRRLMTLSFAFACFVGAAAAQECGTGRSDLLRTRGGWATHRVRTLPPADTGRTVQPRATVVVSASPFQARVRAHVTVAPSCEPGPVDPFNGRRVVVSRTIVTTGPQVAPSCEPVVVIPARPEPIPCAEPVPARGPTAWTNAPRRAIQSLPGPAHADCNALEPANPALTPPPFDILAEELVAALVAGDLERACRLARWLEGRPRYAAAVEAEFFARLPSPTILQRAARRLGRDCGDLRASGSLVRLLGAEGSGD